MKRVSTNLLLFENDAKSRHYHWFPFKRCLSSVFAFRSVPVRFKLGFISEQR